MTTVAMIDRGRHQANDHGYSPRHAHDRPGPSHLVHPSSTGPWRLTSRRSAMQSHFKGPIPRASLLVIVALVLACGLSGCLRGPPGPGHLLPPPGHVMH
jgi:hypothetical protein